VSPHRVKLREAIIAIAPYRQGKPASADAFKLSSNENPYEPLAAVREAIADIELNRYPDASAAVLREKLATRYGVSPANIQVGAGSVSVLAQLISAAASVGDEVVYAWRSFEAYPGLVAVAGATSVQVANTADHRHDLETMLAAVNDRTRVVIVCSPNNPTGTVVTTDEFTSFMDRMPHDVLVILDEAYAEFVTDDSAVRGEQLLGRYPNLVVMRTFSKAYGLAGLRIGYAVGADYIMDAARVTAIPLAVTDQAQQAALASLDAEAQLLERVATIATVRDEVWAALREQGWASPKPHGNFVWLPTGARTEWAAGIFDANGIVARALGDGLRVTIAEPASVGKLLKASAEVVADLRTSAPGATLD
jgi:histidinol-phosphate aminotransferase